MIGIPYSSDAAENTDPETEEKTMKRIGMYIFTMGLVAAAAMILAACGGGGGTTSSAGGTTGTAVVSTGTITKGSVILNGVRFEDTAANITADDTPKTAAFLQSGMTVKLKGRRNDDGVTGTADQVEVENEVRGTITGKGTDSFTVLGQTVFVDGGTVFANVANFAALAVDDAVEVHGSRDAAGAIRATRVELFGGAVVDELRGIVAGKDVSPGPGTFTIGGAAFTYDNTTVIVGGTTFSNGDLVEVHLNGAAATRIELEDAEDNEFDPAEGQEIEVEGYVSGWTATPGNFQVGGQKVQTTSSTRYEGGLSGDLANDVKVEAEGHFRTSDGTLVADKIKFKDSVRFETNVESKTSTSLNVLGREVQVTSKTKNGSLLSTLNVGDGVKIRAFLNQDNVTFTATELATTNAVDPDRHIIQGLVISASNPTIVLIKGTGGFTVDTTGLSDANFKDDNDASIGRAAFFSALKPGQTVVKARGTPGSGTLTVAPPDGEVEIE
ncbi:MAG TPA: DUF5666 domain-containing protein [Candidatus Deferrimicrobiaceae bacterium]